VAGYDVGKLFVGSHGTLGVICEATLRLSPAPAGMAAVRAVFDDEVAAWKAARALAQAPIELAAVEATCPEAAVLVLVEGREDEVERRRERCTEMLSELGGTCGEALEDTEDDRPAQEDLTAVLLRLRLPPALAGDFAHRARQELESLDAEFDLACGATTGLVRLAMWQPNGRAVAELRDAVLTVARQAEEFDSVLEIDDAPAEIRSAVAAATRSLSGVEHMRAIKRAFDPAGILSPRRLPWL
jgi:glycolate oxidase FAD binding subunit